jgi:hypothetical protein
MGVYKLRPMNTHVHHKSTPPVQSPSNVRLALVATAHCLFGCGIGEIVGMITGMLIGMSNTANVALGVILGFVFGIALGVRPLIRAGFAPRQALKQVVVGESLGIAVMEAVDVLVLYMIPGAVAAHFTSPLYWVGMSIALVAGYIAAVPVNYMFIRAGVLHHH